MVSVWSVIICGGLKRSVSTHRRNMKTFWLQRLRWSMAHGVGAIERVESGSTFSTFCDTAPWSVTCRRHTCFSKKSLSFFVSSSRTWGKSMLRVIFAPKSSQTNLRCLRYILLWCRAFCDTSHVESFRSCRRPLQITWHLALKTFLSYSTMYQQVTVCYTRRAILLLLSVLVASNSILGSLASTAARTSL